MPSSTLRLLDATGSRFRVARLHLAAFAALSLAPGLLAQGNVGTFNSPAGHPIATLIQGTDGYFYGTTAGGADSTGTPNSTGIIYQLIADGPRAGAVTTLYNFTAVDASFRNSDGDNLHGSLVQGTDGNFYGTALQGGVNGSGTIFKFTPDGTFTTLHSFGAYDSNTKINSDGAAPQGGLIQGRNGDFYGTTVYGGSSGFGTIFEMTPSGQLTTLFSYNGTNGAYPSEALLQAADGNLYCTTYAGDSTNNGTIIQLTPARIVTVLYNFSGTDGAAANTLIQANDGNFYGTAGGGATGQGIFFRLTPAGKLTTLHNFNGADGDGPLQIIQASDGNFYGTTAGGGDFGGGVVFEVTSTGAVTVLDSFSNADGRIQHPESGLIQGSDGNLFGTTYGADGLYEVYAGLPSAVEFDSSIYSVNEFAGTASIRVNRIGGSEAITVHYATDDESAVAGTDYTAASGTLSWAAGDQAAKYISIQIRNRGVTDGSQRTLALALSDPTGSTSLGHPFTATLTINDVAAPAITSAATAAATVGTAFSYRITATNQPTGYSATGLRDGLALNTATGVISGTPTTAGAVKLTIGASNSAGAGSRTLTITVAANTRPVITSAATASGKVGAAFSYQITATNHPTSYSVSGLRDGLTLNSTTGVIAGTPTTAGTVRLTLSATNSSGTSATVTLTITVAGAPVITSAPTASAQVGKAFSYQITATGSPTSYSATGLRDGLTLNTATGVISGTPTTAGTVRLTLSATNSSGTGSATLTITVAARGSGVASVFER